jgi:hypothetical protein
MRQFFSLSALLFVFFSIADSSSLSSSRTTTSSAATLEYGSYPWYCSKPESVMPLRAIPELSSAHGEHAVLVSAGAIIRHGARTPWEPHKCWEGYDETWDCDETMLMKVNKPHSGNDSSSSGSDTTTDNNGNGNNRGIGGLVFEKIYDGALIENDLQGSCHVGQLIDDGFLQEELNGKHLKKAYIGTGKRKLFESANYTDLDPNDVYFRGDDQQRTLWSGQLLISAMFDDTPSSLDSSTSEEGGSCVDNVFIPYHTADYDSDPIYPNPNICPMLDDMQ